MHRNQNKNIMDIKFSINSELIDKTQLIRLCILGKNSKYIFNFITNNGDLMSNQWFDNVGDFFNGFARVKLNDKGYNFINTEGQLFSEQWFY